MLHRNYENNDAFLDVIMNMLLFFIFIFVILIIQVNPKKQDESVKIKAEFIITISWPDGLADDVDTYFEDPQGRLIHYRQKANGIMHLDRDDLGNANDMIQLPNGKWIHIKTNKEIVTLRGTMKGEYTINVHMYNKSGSDPVPVTVTIEKLNDYKMVYYREVILVENGQEITVCRFTLDDKGEVVSTNELEKKFTSINHRAYNAPEIQP